MRYLPVYLFLINALGLLLMRIDKKNAVHHRQRIPELTLLFVAVIGGSIGALVGMYLFRHKTRKPLFSVGLPLILVLQLLLSWSLWVDGPTVSFPPFSPSFHSTRQESVSASRLGLAGVFFHRLYSGPFGRKKPAPV